MVFLLEHGIYKDFTGSARLKDNEKLVVVTVSGPTDTHNKEFIDDELDVEIKFRYADTDRPLENMIHGIVSSVLDVFVLKEADIGRSISISIFSNTSNLSCILNTTLIALINAGVPLKSVFYSVGNTNLIVFSDNKIVLKHFVNSEEELNVDDSYRQIKESIDYSISRHFIIPQ